MEDVISKWARSFGENAVNVVSKEDVDEDGNIVAPFELSVAIDEFSQTYGVDPSAIMATVVREAATECLSALLDAGYDPLNVSVVGTLLVVVTEPLTMGFQLI